MSEIMKNDGPCPESGSVTPQRPLAIEVDRVGNACWEAWSCVNGQPLAERHPIIEPCVTIGGVSFGLLMSRMSDTTSSAARENPLSGTDGGERHRYVATLVGRTDARLPEVWEKTCAPGWRTKLLKVLTCAESSGFRHRTEGGTNVLTLSVTWGDWLYETPSIPKMAQLEAAIRKGLELEGIR